MHPSPESNSRDTFQVWQEYTSVKFASVTKYIFDYNVPIEKLYRGINIIIHLLYRVSTYIGNLNYLSHGALTSQKDYPPEKTEVIYGIEEITRRTLERFSSTKINIDSCIDPLNPSTNMCKTDCRSNFRPLL
jgi:hypothetical protein